MPPEPPSGSAPPLPAGASESPAPTPARALWPSRPVKLASWTPAEDSEDPITDACEAARHFADEGGTLLLLPALFCFPDGTVDEPGEAAEAFTPVVRALCEACRDTALQVITSLVEAQGDHPAHVGVLLGAAGIIARKPQRGPGERHPWTPESNDDTGVWTLPFGRLAVCVGDDVARDDTAAFAREDAQLVAYVGEAGRAPSATIEGAHALWAQAVPGLTITPLVPSEETAKEAQPSEAASEELPREESRAETQADAEAVTPPGAGDEAEGDPSLNDPGSDPEGGPETAPR